MSILSFPRHHHMLFKIYKNGWFSPKSVNSCKIVQNKCQAIQLFPQRQLYLVKLKLMELLVLQIAHIFVQTHTIDQNFDPGYLHALFVLIFWNIGRLKFAAFNKFWHIDSSSGIMGLLLPSTASEKSQMKSMFYDSRI